MARALSSSRTGEGDQRSWWRGTGGIAKRSNGGLPGGCPSTTLRVVPFPGSGRNLGESDHDFAGGPGVRIKAAFDDRPAPVVPDRHHGGAARAV